MQVAQLRMSSYMAKLNIKQAKGKQHIEQPHAILQIKQPQAEMNMHTTPSKLEINQSKAWEDMNLMSIGKRIAIFGKEGFKSAEEGTGRRAQEGMELMEIENEGSPIVEQATRHAQRPQKELGITFIPSPLSVEITYHPSDVNIDISRHEPIIDANIRKPIHQYERGHATIDMERFADLQIDVINLYA